MKIYIHRPVVRMSIGQVLKLSLTYKERLTFTLQITERLKQSEWKHAIKIERERKATRIIKCRYKRVQHIHTLINTRKLLLPEMQRQKSKRENPMKH